MAGAKMYSHSPRIQKIVSATGDSSIPDPVKAPGAPAKPTVPKVKKPVAPARKAAPRATLADMTRLFQHEATQRGRELRNPRPKRPAMNPHSVAHRQWDRYGRA